MSSFFQLFSLTLPLYVLVLVGFGLSRWGNWPKPASEALSRFVFSVALPPFLFHLMSDFSKLPPVDARLVLAFFGGCLIVFVIGRLIARFLFKLDGVGQSVFALGGVFSNNVLLGLPLAKSILGDAAIPAVALVLVFNSLILWTLVTLSVEWARHGSFSPSGFAKTAWSVLINPIVAAILSGSVFGLLGLKLPEIVDKPIAMMGQIAAPLSLIVVGMGLAEYGIREGWRQSVAISAIKLAIQPLVVWVLAQMLGLPPPETRVVVLLASLAVGVNVYLMSRQFQSMEAPVATSMVLTTALSTVTTPLALTLVGV